MNAFICISTVLSVYIYSNIYRSLYQIYQEYMSSLEKLAGEQEGRVSAAN